jgi:methylated-DNA-[protein]-cysteine S-methyltransferase
MAHIPHAAQCVDTPIGTFTIIANNSALLKLLPGTGYGQSPTPLTEEAAAQLSAYFCGQLHQFDLPLAAAGTPFQQRCWALLETIDYGATRSYCWQAEQLGSRQLARAVGSANGANPLPLFIPCHRIVNADGKPGGYNLGVINKRWLLDHEAAQ